MPRACWDSQRRSGHSQRKTSRFTLQFRWRGPSAAKPNSSSRSSSAPWQRQRRDRDPVGSKVSQSTFLVGSHPTDEMQADDHCRHRGHPRHSGPVNPVRTRVQRETPTSGSEAVCSRPTPIRWTEAQGRTSVRAARWCCGRYRQLTPTNPNDLWRGRPASRQPPPSHTGDESPTNLRGTL
jgi:hypothetical protein